MFAGLRVITKRQWAVLVIAWLGWVFDVADTALFNFAKVPMLTEMLGAAQYKALGPQIEGRIQALFLLGWAVGGLIFGVLADRWGRTQTLVLTVLIYSLCTGLTALCHTPEQVALARFLTALGIGGEWAAGAALVAESFPDAGRAMAASLLQTAAAFGPITAALVNLVLRGQPWQWLFLVGAIPALMCVWIRTRIHDAPTGDWVKPKNPLREVWADRESRSRTLTAMIIGAVGITGAGTAVYWQPNLVKAVSVGLPKAELDARTSTVAIVSHFGTLLGVLVVPWLCQRFGRKRTIGAFFVAAPLAVGLAIGGGASYERLLALLPLVNFFAIGVSAAFVLYFPELFPGRIRATGAGLAYNVGRVLAIPMPLFTAWAIGLQGSSVATGIMMSAGVYLFGLIALGFAPETKGQALQ